MASRGPYFVQKCTSRPQVDRYSKFFGLFYDGPEETEREKKDGVKQGQIVTFFFSSSDVSSTMTTIFCSLYISMSGMSRKLLQVTFTWGTKP